MKKLTFLTLIVSVLVLQGTAQKVTNVKAAKQGNKVVVSYKVVGGTSDRVYSPALYYSTDGGSSYNKCKSTSAKYAKPNQTAQITWDVTKDLDYFGGDNVVFKVTAYHKLLIDGKYKTVKIGKQVWLAENLNLDVGNGCWCYDNEQNNCKKYGRLYTWEAAKRAANKIAGWHLPTDAEWTQLENFLGGSSVAGKKLKSTHGWQKDGNGTNSNGFSALPGGDRSSSGGFSSKGYGANFWTATAYDSYTAWRRYLYYSHLGVGCYDYHKGIGYSVRLVRD